jgi:predicted PurR-regulated permease PerM
MFKKINKKSDPKFYRPFLWFLIIVSLILVFYLFRPFLVEIIIAASLASVFFSFYEKLKKRLWNKKYLAAFLMCLSLFIFIITPSIALVAYAAKQAPDAYRNVSQFLSEAELVPSFLLERFNITLEAEEAIKGFVMDSTKKVSDWLVSSTTMFLIGTTNFVISLLIIIITMFFFFVNGHEIVNKLILWSPLPNKYDLEIADKFRKISYNTIFSLFVAAIVQGTLSALGLLVVGWPFLLSFVISAFLSIIPYMLALFFIPIIIYLFLDGQIWQAIFVTIWNLIIVVNVDELIRAYIIKGKTQVNMIFMVFALLGGISLFGFWGVFIGPIILALALSVFYIYELEFKKHLDK